MNSTKTKAAAIAFGITLLTAVGCGSSAGEDSSADTTTVTTEAEAPTTTAAPAELSIEDPWARTSPMAVTLGAAYMEITSPVDDRLISASAPQTIAKTTEVHETVAVDSSTDAGDMGETTTEPMMATTTAAMGETTVAGGSDDGGMDEGGMGGEMEMREVESIELPAGEMVALKPGGYHVMLIDLVAPLEAGQTFELTLSFEVAGERTVTVTVRDA